MIANATCQDILLIVRKVKPRTFLNEAKVKKVFTTETYFNTFHRLLSILNPYCAHQSYVVCEPRA